MRTKVRGYFTLLELCIVLAILSLLAGLLGVKAHSGYQAFAFRKSVREFTAHLSEVRLLALAYQTDISIELWKENDSLYYIDATDELRCPIQRKKAPLSGIAQLSWEGKPQKKIQLQVLSSGKIATKGELCLQKAELQHKITLK